MHPVESDQSQIFGFLVRCHLRYPVLMKHVHLCLQLCWLGSAIIAWSTELNQANSASFSLVSYKWRDCVNLSLYDPLCVKKLEINMNSSGQEVGFSALLAHFHCEGGLTVMVESRVNIREMLPILATSLSLLCSPGWEKPLTISRAAHVGNWFLHNFEENWKCSASCQRAHQEDESRKKPKPTSPSLLLCKSMHLLHLKQNSRKAGIFSSFPLGIQETD